ncbi:BcsE family c-di-GMP-binding protein [Noviherbaspirillum malthae]|uniref:BcsE family c-di-GMP-binding protein n=1 Tax=Noviherbaspirillum malthae TaxID=1260987 RepID=UPI00188F2697|nr:BcsE family c-di-GMP-binding protein [Noviherbaspirillum malthae]
MDDILDPASSAPVARLGIDGLPNLTSAMLPGGAYALVAGTPPARFPVLVASLADAVDAGLHCTLIVPSHPELLVERIASYGLLDLHALLQSGQVAVFEMQEEFAKNMFRFGADGFVQELEFLGVPQHSYVIVDQADDLLALHDVSLALAQVDVLRRWLEQRKTTALFAFSRAGAAQAPTINALMDSLQGLARLQVDKQGLDLTFDYWHSPDGTVAARTFHLLPNSVGLYSASTRPALAAIAAGGRVEDAAPLPDDDRTFFYMDPDLGSLAHQCPGIWQRVDTLVGMMHATRGRTGATIILAFYRDTRLRYLAEAVHTLRLSLGRYVRIVVQEKDASLRYQNEALLLRLGVNLVVHRDVAPSRLPLLLESLRGQVFSRDVNIDFEAALASVLPTHLRGYLAPERFISEVGVVLDRAENLNIPCALIVGSPTSSRKVVDIIKTSAVSRSGDLITADTTQCFLFLNACPQPALLSTLQRILGAPLEVILEDVRFLVTRDDMMQELAALARASKRGQLPDYSALVPATPAPEKAADTSEERSPDATDRLPRPVDTWTARAKMQEPVRAAQLGSAAGNAPLGAPPPTRVIHVPASVQVVDVATSTLYTYNDVASEKRAGRRDVPRAVRSAAGTALLSPAKPSAAN